MASALAQAASEASDTRFERETGDDELRMLFVCADDAIPAESQTVLALKILCGFSTREIALRLLTTEDNVHKRLARGRERLRQLGASLDTPASSRGWSARAACCCWKTRTARSGIGA